MLAIERRNDILERLHQKRSVTVTELSEIYKVSEETIRRDLEKLETDGFLRKTYGGAVLNDSTSLDLPLRVRERANQDEKVLIAKKISDTVEDGDTIMLDSSSTAIFISKALKTKKKLTIITNSIEIPLGLAGCTNINVISTGGELRESSLSLVGRIAKWAVSNFNVDKAVISCKGIDMVKGVTESNESEMEIKQAMMASAKQVILAADSSKFGNVSFVGLMPVSSAGIVVSNKFDAEWVEFFKESGIHYI